MEVLINGVWSVVDTNKPNENLSLFRTGIVVACRTLGFDTGAQMLVGASSAYPASLSAPDLVLFISCNGSEKELSGCSFKIDDTADYEEDFYTQYDILQDMAVALVCNNPSGLPLRHNLT